MNAGKKQSHCFFSFALIACAAFSAASCSQSTGAAQDFPAEKTLRASVSESAASVQWTLNDAHTPQTEAEHAAGTQDQRASGAHVSADTYTPAEVRLPSGSSQNAESIFASLLALEKPVYPFLEGFTVLDSSALPRAARPLLNRVLEGCKSKKLDEAFFASGLGFLKTVAEYELQSLPEADSWIVGYAQKSGGSVYEVSVRFFGARGFFDAYVYIAEDGSGEYKVEQLFFGKAEK